MKRRILMGLFVFHIRSVLIGYCRSIESNSRQIWSSLQTNAR